MVVPHCQYRTFTCEECPGCCEFFPVPPALFPVSFCADVDLLLAGILACPEEAGRDVMLFAGRRIPAGNAGVDGILCTGWGSPAGFVADFGAVLAPLTSQRGGNVPELPWTPAESAAWSWSRRWELLMPGICCSFPVLWKVSLLGVLTWAPAWLWLGWRVLVMPSSLSAALGSLCVFSAFSEVAGLWNHRINKFGKDLQDYQVSLWLSPAIPMKPNSQICSLFESSLGWWLHFPVESFPPLPVLNHSQWKDFSLVYHPTFHIPENKSSEWNYQTLWAGLRCQLWDLRACAHQALPPLTEKPWIKNSNQIFSKWTLGKPRIPFSRDWAVLTWVSALSQLRGISEAERNYFLIISALLI